MWGIFLVVGHLYFWGEVGWGEHFPFFIISCTYDFKERKKGNVLFNDKLNTFYFMVILSQTYGIGPSK